MRIYYAVPRHVSWISCNTSVLLPRDSCPHNMDEVIRHVKRHSCGGTKPRSWSDRKIMLIGWGAYRICYGTMFPQLRQCNWMVFGGRTSATEQRRERWYPFRNYRKHRPAQTQTFMRETYLLFVQSCKWWSILHVGEWTAWKPTRNL